MSNNLPVPRTGMEPETITSNAGRSSSLTEWIGSPVGRAIAQVLPDIIRMATRSRPADSQPTVSHILPSSDGASGMTLSEVEVDVDAPFIRKVTIRSASSWSVAPDVILAEQRNQRRSRWKRFKLASVARLHRRGVERQ